MEYPVTHNPDTFMADLRQMLSQGKKRIGLLIGAGAPMSIRVPSGKEEGDSNPQENPLIPGVADITSSVLKKLNEPEQEIIDKIKSDIGENANNIEHILTRVRKLSQALSGIEVGDVSGDACQQLADSICEKIGTIVAENLPDGSNPYTELVAWIGGTHRRHPIEIFTPNYDLLLEEAFERGRVRYFDGFVGAHRPFFDPTTVIEDDLTPPWSRVWKIHGSLGWDIDAQESAVFRTGDRGKANLIYPDHLKYDHITRQPFSAFFERLRKFLAKPDSLLLCAGFSFSDAHIRSVISEALSTNAHAAVLAFQYRMLNEEEFAVGLARERSNVSVYARDGAVICGVEGSWVLGRPRARNGGRYEKPSGVAVSGRGKVIFSWEILQS